VKEFVFSGLSFFKYLIKLELGVHSNQFSHLKLLFLKKNRIRFPNNALENWMPYHRVSDEKV